MDKSKKYIKMCEKAEEIQNEWKPKIWDIIHNKQSGLPFATIDACKTIGGQICAYITSASVGIITQQPTGKKHSLIVWLPTQNQLQEMVIGRGLSWTLISFFQWCQKNIKEHHWLQGKLRKYDSMEQLWLAFVMHEKYGKNWNGEDWMKKI